MNDLENLFKEIETYIPKHILINPSVSKSSVGWHIEHSLLSVKLMIEGLKISNPENYKWKFNHIRTLVFTMKKIPRGKGKAPEISLPVSDFNETSLIKNVSAVNDMINELKTLDPKSYISHPVFGDLNLRATRKLLLIHTRHHLEIIKDIVESLKA